MNINVNDSVILKKPHPCGTNRFVVTRVGMDIKLKCTGCGKELEFPRAAAEKRIKKTESNDAR